MKTLIVDDSGTMRKIIINILEGAGFTDNDQAMDGQQAVDAVQKADYDLVLLDWNMPQMLGIDALKQIRSLGYKMPVIMVTTEAEKGRVMEALKSGANNYVIKPFRPDVILSKISDTLGAANPSTK